MDTRKRLYRSRNDQMIAGVCGGLAEYLEVDSTLVRLAVILLTLVGGAGVLAYIIAWIIVPEGPLAPELHRANQESTMSETTPAENPKPDKADKTNGGQTGKTSAKSAGTQTVHHDAPNPKPSHEPDHTQPPTTVPGSSERGRTAFGLILITVGVTLYLQLAYDINLWRYSGPIALIVIGLLLILRRR